MLRNTKAIGVVLVAVLAGLSLVVANRHADAAGDPSGEWTLDQIEEDDGSVHDAPVTVDIKYEIDTVNKTVENNWYYSGGDTPFDTTSFSYTVKPSGNWYIANAGPGGRTMELSVTVTSSGLELTRVAYTGPDCATAPAPIYQGAAPAAPTTIPPPQTLFLVR